METKLQYVPLGELITPSEERNSDKQYSEDSVRGLSTAKQIIETKANLDGVSLTSYKIMHPKDFAFVPDTSRRGEKISLGFNETDKSYLVSSISEVFHVTYTNRLLPEYLFLIFNRPEFDRYARFNSWGSAREAFSYEDMCRVIIPLPSIEEQEKVVSVWQGLRDIQQQNAALAKPLLQLCQSYIQECKHKYSKVRIGKFMTKGGKNGDGNISRVLGIGQNGFMSPQKIPNESLKNYKILTKNAICYAPPLYNILCDAIHLYRQDIPAVCSPIYEVFYIDEKIILPEYLTMWLKRQEFKRYAEYYALGVRNTFNYNLMEEVKIPLPPIEVQQAIVNLYRCAQECQALAKEAAEQAKNICPALIQQVIKS